MNVKEFAKKLDMVCVTPGVDLEKEITGIYCCDLLSWAMAKVQKGNIWITVHGYVNIIAVASLTEASCIIVPENIKVDDATIDKAIQNDVVILSCKNGSYEICKDTYKLLNF